MPAHRRRTPACTCALTDTTRDHTTHYTDSDLVASPKPSPIHIPRHGLPFLIKAAGPPLWIIVPNKFSRPPSPPPLCTCAQTSKLVHLEHDKNALTVLSTTATPARLQEHLLRIQFPSLECQSRRAVALFNASVARTRKGSTSFIAFAVNKSFRLLLPPAPEAG